MSEADLAMIDPEDDLPNFGLSDEWLAAMGRLIVQWAAFDYFLRSHIAWLLDDPKGKPLKPKSARQSVRARLALYEKLAPLFFEGEALKQANMALKMARATKDDREWVAHGMGMELEDGKLTIIRTDEMDTFEPVTKDASFTYERLTQAARVIEEARLCLLHAFSSISLPLPSWLQKL